MDIVRNRVTQNQKSGRTGLELMVKVEQHAFEQGDERLLQQEARQLADEQAVQNGWDPHGEVDASPKPVKDVSRRKDNGYLFTFWYYTQQ